MRDDPVRVVVTGLGALSPLGVGVEALWDGLLAGRSGIRPIRTFDASRYDTQLGGEVPDFDALVFMGADVAGRVGRATQFAIAAGRMALVDAELAVALPSGSRRDAGAPRRTEAGSLEEGPRTEAGSLEEGPRTEAGSLEEGPRTGAGSLEEGPRTGAGSLQENRSPKGLGAPASRRPQGAEPESGYAPERIGLCLGTTMGEIQELEAACAGQPGRLRRYPAAQLGRGVAEELGLEGPNTVIPTACAAGNYSIGHALDLLRDGRADAVLAGGVDVMAEVQFSGFGRLRSMSPDVPRPFSAGREGMMVSEGAGFLVLEPLEGALARGARIYAEVLGYGLSCDANHMTAPHPEGAGAQAAMAAALADAGLEPPAVSYINAHGTGTPANDRIETLAIKRLLGDHAYKVPVTSIKSMLGHTMGAASALEGVVTTLIVFHGRIPATANYAGPDPDCDLDYVTAGPRDAAVAVALSNSYAFGGNNACLVLGRMA